MHPPIRPESAVPEIQGYRFKNQNSNNLSKSVDWNLRVSNPYATFTQKDIAGVPDFAGLF